LPVGTGAQTLTALARGQVDALSYYRGSIALFETKGMAFHHFAPDLPGAVLAVRDDVLAARRADIIAALKGVVLDSVYMQTNPQAAVRAYWKLYGMPKGDVDKALKAGEHLIVRTQEIGTQIGDGGLWGDMNDATWMKLINYMGASGGLHLTQSALSNIYTNELIAEVNKVDIKIAIEAARNG
jgi:ABC-type nitrate/sulfonate/bicarbonate transport system substrate-binding protein